MIKKYLLDNSHHLRLLYSPDPKHAEKDERRNTLRMQTLASRLSNSEKETIV